MMDAFKKALKQKQSDNFAIIIAKVDDDHNKSSKMDSPPEAAEHKKMVGDDSIDDPHMKLAMHGMENESPQEESSESMADEADEPKSMIKKELMGRDYSGGLGAKIKELLMSKKK